MECIGLHWIKSGKDIYMNTGNSAGSPVISGKDLLILKSNLISHGYGLQSSYKALFY
jgi:hypothetical protein